MQAISLLHVNIPWHTAVVELLQQQINGCGSVQAVNGKCCIICMQEIWGRALRAFAASKYHCFEKWAWLMISKHCSGIRRCPSISCFSQFCLTWCNLGLTRMTQDHTYALYRWWKFWWVEEGGDLTILYCYMDAFFYKWNLQVCWKSSKYFPCQVSLYAIISLTKLCSI